MKITIQTADPHPYNGGYPDDIALSVAAIVSEDMGLQGATVTVDMENGNLPRSTTT